MTVPRCGCGRVLRSHEKPTGICLECSAVNASLRGLGKLKEYPVVPAAECMGKLCALCQHRNTPARSEAMYHHNDGPVGTHWFAHTGCEIQREYDKFEEWRDTRDWEGDGPIR